MLLTSTLPNVNVMLSNMIILHFYDFCSFWHLVVNIMIKLQFLQLYMYLLFYNQFQYTFSFNIFRKFRR